MLKEKLGRPAFETLDKMLSSVKGNVAYNHDISYKLVLISPGRCRDNFVVNFPTVHLKQLIVEAINDHSLAASARFFKIFVRDPKSKALAGNMLDDAFHRILLAGGQWPITRLKSNKPGSKNTHWSVGEGTCYLGIGYAFDTVLIQANRWPDGSKFKPLEVELVVPGATISKLKDAYYRPVDAPMPTFDSFIYHSGSGIATVFQAFVSSIHDVNKKGFGWLKAQGVTKFRYVVVVPENNRVNLPFPNNLEESLKIKIDEKYILSLGSIHPDTNPDLESSSSSFRPTAESMGGRLRVTISIFSCDVYK
jgi:hypothetical protein